jgi:hypothetical protein
MVSAAAMQARLSTTSDSGRVVSIMRRDLPQQRLHLGDVSHDPRAVLSRLAERVVPASVAALIRKARV